MIDVQLLEMKDEMSRNLTRIAELLFDSENWEVHELDERNIFSPVWPDGDFLISRSSLFFIVNISAYLSICFFLIEPTIFFFNYISRNNLLFLCFRMAELRELYSKVRVNQNAFSVMIAYIQGHCDFQYRHYCLTLIYNVLEKEYIFSEGFTENVDISIKYLLSSRDSTLFYGAVFPYFDPLRFLRKIFPSGGLTLRFLYLVHFVTTRTPELVKYLLIVTISIVSFYIDFVKDIIIASEVSFLYQDSFWDFKSFIVVVLWVTVFLSQCIVGLKIIVLGPARIFAVNPSSVSRTKKMILTLFLCIICPVAPALLLFLNARLGREVRVQEKIFSQTCKSTLSVETTKLLFHHHAQRGLVLKKIQRLENILVSSYKLDIALENTPQVLVQVLIVVLATSHWRFQWLTGIEAVFDTHDSSSSLSTVFFYFSIIWSLITIQNSLFSTFLFSKDYSVGDLGKVLVYFNILLGASVRIFSIILAFAPFLGLFDLMLGHHLDSRFKFSSAVWDLYGETLELSRTYSWYTGFQFKTFLLMITVSPILHVLLVNIYYLTTVLERKKESFRFYLNLTMHSFTTLLIPNIRRDWDEIPKRECQGETDDIFMINWRRIRHEYIVMVVIHLLENLILLIPVYITSVRNVQRTLSIPLLQEELKVYHFSIFLLISPVLFLILACLQIKLFILYNEKAHPWSIIFKKK